MEPNEIGEFSKQMKEAGEESMTHVSLIISVLAVLVALVTVLGHRTHTEATLMQTRAGDKWNEYQARKLRLQGAANTNLILSRLGTAAKEESSSTASADDDSKPASAAQLDKWKEENKEASAEAKEYEEKVELAETKAFRFDLGEALLQIAVILASITLLTRRSVYVTTALVLGLGGMLVAASAFLVH